MQSPESIDGLGLDPLDKVRSTKRPNGESRRERERKKENAEPKRRRDSVVLSSASNPGDELVRDRVILSARKSKPPKTTRR